MESFSGKYDTTKINKETIMEKIKKIYINALDNTRINEEEKLFEYLDSNIKDTFINYLKDSGIFVEEKKGKRRYKYSINGVPLVRICKEDEKLEEAIKMLKYRQQNKEMMKKLENNIKFLEEDSTENIIPRDINKITRVPFPNDLIDKLESLFIEKYDGKKMA